MTTGTTIADHRSPIATAPPQTLVDTLIAAFQHAALGVAVHGTTGSLLAANEAFHRMLGSPLGEPRGTKRAGRFHRCDPGRNRSLIAALAGGETESVVEERRCQRPDGSAFWSRPR